jgi:hypothetical protein
MGSKKIILLFVILVGITIPAAVYLIKNQTFEMRKAAIRDEYQCTVGCDGRVCDTSSTVGYSWCSKDKRCRCTSVGKAEAYPENDQYWCESGRTMYCGEITPGNCGLKVDASDRKSCGGGGATCKSYTECFNKLECEWPATTYCINGQCTCSDVQQQRLYGLPRGWLVCEDTSPKCTPAACPSGWLDCGLNYARTDYSTACVRKVKCGPVGCNPCQNTYVVWRYCKPVSATPTPTPTPTPPGQTPTPTPTPTPPGQTPTPKPTPTATPTPTPTPPGQTPTPTPTPTARPTPTPTSTPGPGQASAPTPTPIVPVTPQAGTAWPTFFLIMGGVLLVSLGLIL